MKANSLSGIDLFPMSDSLYPGDVKHIGLKSTISSQMFRKYSRNQDFRSVKNVKLIIPSQAVSVLKK
jgi:putative transposase